MASLTRRMVCRLVPNSRASADTVAPSSSRRCTLLPLLRRQARRPAQPLALRPGPAQPRPGALDQQVALELRDRVDDAHRQLAGRAGEVDAAQRQAVDPHADPGELGHRGAHVRGVAAEPVEPGDHQHVAGLQPVEQARETPALSRDDAAGDGLGHDPARLDSEAGRPRSPRAGCRWSGRRWRRGHRRRRAAWADLSEKAARNLARVRKVGQLSSSGDERTRWGSALAVEGLDGLVDGDVEGVGVAEGAVGEVVALQVAPGPLDVVQLGRVLRQPLDREPGPRRQRLPARLARVDRAVVEHQDYRPADPSRRRAVDPVEPPQQGDEVARALGPAGEDDQLAPAWSSTPRSARFLARPGASTRRSAPRAAQQWAR